LGDDIQAIKAGLVEIADIFVVNKADRAGADAAVRALQFMLESGSSSLRSATAAGTDEIQWRTPICKTIAHPTGAGAGTGLAELVSQLDAHRAFLDSSGRRHTKERMRAQTSLKGLLRQELLARFLSTLEADEMEDTVSRIALRQMSLYEALDHLLSASARSPRDKTM
jgi:LAO/AO transport system kinase